MPGSDPGADGRHAWPAAGLRDPGRRGSRRGTTVALLLLLAAAVPYAITLGLLWSSTGSALTASDQERSGVILLRPLVTLLAATADAQTAGVAGRDPDLVPLTAASKAVDAADARVGSALGTARRWADLRSRVADVVAAHPRTDRAYTQYTQLVDVETAMITAVGDASSLSFDSGLDSSYLVGTSLDQLPTLIVGAGRLADLVRLDTHRPAGTPANASVGAIQTHDVHEAAAAIDTDLRKSFANTTSTSLAPGLLTRLDRLRDAVATLAPPLADVGAPTTDTRSADALQTARAQVRDTALTVETGTLDQLDRLLADRASGPRTTRLVAGLATLAGVLVAGAVGWVVGPRRAPDPSALDDEAASPEPAAPDEPGSLVGEDLMEARELLESRRLVRVGRAVAAREKAQERR